MAHKNSAGGIALKKKRGDYAMISGIVLAALIVVLIVVASSERAEAILEQPSVF